MGKESLFWVMEKIGNGQWWWLYKMVSITNATELCTLNCLNGKFYIMLCILSQFVRNGLIRGNMCETKWGGTQERLGEPADWDADTDPK